MTIENIVKALKSDLDGLTKTFKADIDSLQEQIKKLTEVSSNFDRNWAGQWASRTYNIYNNFVNGNGQLQLDEDAILKYIEEQTGIKLEDIKSQIPKISKTYRVFQDKVVTELSIINGKENFEPEIELLSKIEKQEWGITPWDYVKMRRPQSIMTHDPFILNKGLDTPPHLKVGGELMSLFSILASTENFEKNVQRILRQLELKLSIEDLPSVDSDFIPKLLNSFHNVARQLLNRHSNRETLRIDDEYDVQDLLHSMLRIQFDDIRAEEYTPSYAGSSTRVDFLLKREKIVIEVKKTRKGLADKEVGDQLILDTQHYKAHPDCKKLICFVYDPENRIQNPRGLEDDLNSISSDNLLVEVYIRP